MTRASPPPDYQSYFCVAEWPVKDSLPLFKGTTGVMTSQCLGLRKAVTNVLLMLNHLEERELSTSYRRNPMLNLVATASEDGRELAVLGFYHPSIKPYETNGVVTYDVLLAGLERDGIGPVAVTLHFANLTPGASYTETVSVVDSAHGNAFAYRHAVMDDLQTHCGPDPTQWQKVCVYDRMEVINDWTLEEDGASVATETTDSTLTADTEGQGEIVVTMNPYSVLLVRLERTDR